jgi:hypothetical protein
MTDKNFYKSRLKEKPKKGLVSAFSIWDRFIFLIEKHDSLG